MLKLASQDCETANDHLILVENGGACLLTLGMTYSYYHFQSGCLLSDAISGG